MITSTRSYKRAASPEEARAEIARCAGAEFDPRLVRAFLNMSLGRMRLVLGPVSWLTHAPLLARLPLTPTFGATIVGAAALATTAATGLAQPRATVAAAPPTAVPRAVSVPRAESQPVVELVDPTRTTAARPAKHKSGVPRVDPSSAPPTLTLVTVVVTVPSTPGVTTTDARPSPTGPGTPGTTTSDTSPRGSGPTTTHTTTTTTVGATTTTTKTTTTTTPATTTTTSKKGTPPTTTTTLTATAPDPNVAPSFALSGNQTVLEDAGSQHVDGFAHSISPGPSRESGQAVTFSVSTDHSSLFSAPPSLSAGGLLTYTTAPNANGTATVTVVARDDGGTANGGSDTSAPQTFTISITSVNDAPSFAAGANQTAISLLGAQTVKGWASGISPGPADEAGQTVTFTVTVDKPGLFATPPAIGPDGTLTYKPTLLAIGTATVTVRAVDNGGTANGGVNTSAAQTFTIAIA